MAKIIKHGTLPSNIRVAGFDLDYTIIKPKSGKKFPQNHEDWKFLYDQTTIDKLREISKTHTIIWFTNQKRCNDDLITKIETILKLLNLPIWVFIAIDSGYYRKPFTGLWSLLEQETSIDLKGSFYCGDAAGRPGDFAATDSMFAHNLAIKFLTPEAFFLSHPLPHLDIDLGGIQDYLKAGEILPESITKAKHQLVLMVGYPGSGKSSLARSLDTHNLVSNDLGKSKCVKLTRKALENKENVVIDGTNYSRKLREIYINLAKEFNYRVVVIHITNSIQASFYLNQYRCEMGKGKEPLIPKIAYYKIRKGFEMPSLDEGIDIIHKFTNYLDTTNMVYLFEPF